MADAGFSKTQIKQLEGLFEKSTKQTNDSIFHAVNSLSGLIEEVKEELNGKIDSVKTELKDDIRNLTTTFATKYEVEELRKKVSGVSSAHD